MTSKPILGTKLSARATTVSARLGGFNLLIGRNLSAEPDNFILNKHPQYIFHYKAGSLPLIICEIYFVLDLGGNYFLNAQAIYFSYHPVGAILTQFFHNNSKHKDHQIGLTNDVLTIDYKAHWQTLFKKRITIKTANRPFKGHNWQPCYAELKSMSVATAHFKMRV